MNFHKSELENYKNLNARFIPVHPWNKKVKGSERGKTPVHSDWTKREYKADAHRRWIDKGYNIGFRIQAAQAVFDLDPRNYEFVDSEQLLAELFGYFDFDELIENEVVVKTGGGGYHIYCTLPESEDYRHFRECVEELPGVEFKRKGRQVLAAGSRHPSGNYYEWISNGTPSEVPVKLLELYKRKNADKPQDYSNGRGAFTGQQLRELVLDKLSPEDYDNNDKWFVVLCGAHHATDGHGIEEFLEWCLQDERYADDENVIRNRWESLSEKDISITAASLIRELRQSGEDTSEAKTLLTFGGIANDEDEDEDEEESDSDSSDNEEARLVKESELIAREIDLSDVFQTPDLDEGVEGKAIEAAKNLRANANNEEVMKCLRLIKAADSLEAMKAQELLVANKVLKQASINKLLKQLEEKMSEDLALVISRKTLEKTFNKGKHLTSPPNGAMWVYNKTHWRPISEEFLGKLTQKTLHALKQKVDISGQELSLITQAVKLTKIEVSTLSDRIHRTDLPPSIINCKNGELHMNKDGSHTLKPHVYKSYLLNCLNVDYDPSAECPLFMETITDIFSNYPDCDDMVRHIGEMMGYTIQPYKNIASWWLFRGPGGDGKSTLTKIIGGILQDALLATGSKILSSGSSEGYNHALTSLVGKLAVVIEELPANYLLKDAGVKMFSENTKMEANPKGKEAFQFMYAGTLIMCSNGFPATRDLSHGMFRRANVIPFNKQFTKNGSADLDRADRILRNPEEMAGILNFALAGLQRLRDRGGFIEPKSCLDAKETWLGEANNIVRFLKERIDFTGKGTDCAGNFSELFSIHYQNWCGENDIEDSKRKRKSQFKRDLEHLGFVVRTGGGNQLKVYGGTVKEDEFDDFEMDEEF